MISKGNHVKFACFVLLAVSEETKTLIPFFFFCSYIYKKNSKLLLDSAFVMFKIIKVLARVSPNFWLSLTTLTSTLIILDITKTSSWSVCCLISGHVMKLLKILIFQLSNSPVFMNTLFLDGWNKQFLENIRWRVIGKQTTQAKEVYSRAICNTVQGNNSLEH